VENCDFERSRIITGVTEDFYGMVISYKDSFLVEFKFISEACLLSLAKTNMLNIETNLG
jgi:hypothetical protein